MAEILVTDDDPNIRELLTDLLEGEGFQVRTAEDGAKALTAVKQKKPDLLILDIMMPNKSGYDVCREIRQTDPLLPILMLTAKSEDVDKVLGLERGADDYMTKPFSPQELLARVRALLRRATAQAPAPAVPSPFETAFKFGKRHTVDPKRFVIVDARKHETKLSKRELGIIRHFAEHPGEVIEREFLLQRFWGYGVNGEINVTTRTVDTHIYEIREKLGTEKSLIATVHGIGWRYDG